MLNLHKTPTETHVITSDHRAGCITHIGRNPYAVDNRIYAYVEGIHLTGGFKGFRWADYYAAEQLDTPEQIRTQQQVKLLDYLLDTLKYETQMLTGTQLETLATVAQEIADTAEDAELIKSAGQVQRWAAGTLTEREEVQQEEDRIAAENDPYRWVDDSEDDWKGRARGSR